MEARRVKSRRTDRARTPVNIAPPRTGTAGGMCQVLKDADVRSIHDAALEVLARVGFKGPTATVRTLALEAGFRGFLFREMPGGFWTRWTRTRNGPPVRRSPSCC